VQVEERRAVGDEACPETGDLDHRQLVMAKSFAKCQNNICC